MARSHTSALLVGLLLVCATAAVYGARQPDESQNAAAANRRHRKKKKNHPYTSPAGLFIQERASKQLPGPGQHFSFGALKPWEDVLAMLDDKPDRKLLLVVRHGQAISNYLGDTLGPDEWYRVEGTCQYDDGNGTIYNIFDADLTGLGEDQAKSLNGMLVGGGWYKKMTADKAVRIVISPLARCLHTATVSLAGIKANATNVEEFVRETLGEDTCDARRSVSDPNHAANRAVDPEEPCSFDKGLETLYAQYKYKVYDPRAGKHRGLGLLGDSDHLWTKDKREAQKHQVKRAKKFLDILYDVAPEQVVIVITHSGFTRSLLLAVRREPYRPQNAEMVPVIVDKHSNRELAQGEITNPEDDSWIDEVLAGYESMDSEVGGLENSAGERVAIGKQKQGCFVKWMKQVVDRLIAGWNSRQQLLSTS